LKEFSAHTLGIQGSGWGWLGFNPKNGAFEVATTPSQDPLLIHVPIIGVDIWEYPFYLQCKNVKPDMHISPTYPLATYHLIDYLPSDKLTIQYLNAIWHVIKFEEAVKRFLNVNSKL